MKAISFNQKNCIKRVNQQINYKHILILTKRIKIYKYISCIFQSNVLKQINLNL